jgi:PHD/YefM family antitoxin component YafN of YafNO toxin-antitoxin module
MSEATMNPANGMASATEAPSFPLEEEMEESSVTDLRNGLLPTIERIQQNAALRVLIRKHGSPRAVLMSVRTYDALKKLATLAVQRAEATSREEQIEAAFGRLENEREPVLEGMVEVTVSQPASVGAFNRRDEARFTLGQIQEKLRELDNSIGA